jgi:predicted dehydrogenase
MTTDLSVVRIGVLGAAKVVKSALVAPADRIPGVEVTSIASRDQHRARAFAAKRGIPRVLSSYETVLADPEIDAVYIPLPATLHARWTIAAIDAGKHVLCEKPFTSNAKDAVAVARRASQATTVVMEAYHSSYHPLQTRLREILDSGELGPIARAKAHFYAPIPPGPDIRWNLSLGGGALLDIGYYPLRQLRELFGPVESVESARAWQLGGIDRLLTTTLRFTGGVRGEVESSMWSRKFLGMGLDIHGERGRMRVSWPFHPQHGARLRITTPSGNRTELTTRRSSYIWQLEVFRDAVLNGAAVRTNASAAVTQMLALDEIYRNAGMEPRP